MQEAIKQITNLHKKNTANYISVLQLQKETNFTYRQFLKNVYDFENQKDVYFTSNTFYPRRLLSHLKQLKNLYIDLDVLEKTELSIAEAVYKMYLLVDRNIIPEPSLVVDSGRGLHVYWTIEVKGKEFLSLWQEITDNLYYKLKHLGADRHSTDATRQLRLVNTVNSKNNKKVKILHSSRNTYTLEDLQEKYCTQKKPRNKTKTNNKINTNTNNKINMFNSYTLHMTRLYDIQTLVRLRNYDMEGYRNFLVMCFSYWTGIYTRNQDDLKELVYEFNNSFKESLKAREVDSVVRSVNRAIDKFIDYEQSIRDGVKKRVTKSMRDKEGYWFTNETLIERLNITDSEQRQMKTIISTKEKYRRKNERRTERNQDGLTAKQQKKQNNIKATQQLKNEGLTNKEIANKLNLSDRYVRELLNS